MLDFRVNTFLAVCQTLNFTQASKELGLTQPAVSQHIKLLENFYHTRLFHYENKKLTLTAAGQLLLERFTTMQNDENALLEELSSQDTGIETLSLGVTMTIGEYAIISPLAKFLKEHPNLNINLRFGNTQQLLQPHGQAVAAQADQSQDGGNRHRNDQGQKDQLDVLQEGNIDFFRMTGQKFYH